MNYLAARLYRKLKTISRHSQFVFLAPPQKVLLRQLVTDLNKLTYFNNNNPAFLNLKEEPKPPDRMKVELTKAAAKDNTAKPEIEVSAVSSREDSKTDKILAHSNVALPQPADIKINDSKTLAMLKLRTIDCSRCPLAKRRQELVFGSGYNQAKIMFIGEGPGREEDLSGEPFVGRGGNLLKSMIAAIVMTDESVYITNVVKCRPPSNRVPAKEELAACRTILLKQISLINPRLIVLVGKTALNSFFPEWTSITKARRRILSWQGYNMIATFHPAYILRSRSQLGEYWKDFKWIQSYIIEHGVVSQ